jgi:hypothetical protein
MEESTIYCNLITWPLAVFKNVINTKRRHIRFMRI